MKKWGYLASNKTWRPFSLACRAIGVGCEILNSVVGEKRSMYSTDCFTWLDSCCLSTALWQGFNNSHLSLMTLSESRLWANDSHPSFSLNNFLFLPDERFCFDSGKEQGWTELLRRKSPNFLAKSFFSEDRRSSVSRDTDDARYYSVVGFHPDILARFYEN